jgi:hypothetical protein
VKGIQASAWRQSLLSYTYRLKYVLKKSFVWSIVDLFKMSIGGLSIHPLPVLGRGLLDADR